MPQDPLRKKKVITVGFPLYDDCTLLDFAGATQVFAPFAGGGFQPVWLAKEVRPIPTTETVSVMPHATLADSPPLDILFVPGGGSGVNEMMCDEEFLGEIRRLAKTCHWIGSVCTGAFILAAAGLLDGHQATTYWSQLGNLALFPKLKVDQDDYPRALIKRGRFTGGGVSSSIDLALYLVKKLRGKKVCEAVQLAIQYAPEPPYDSGDPTEAPKSITAAALKGQKPFLAEMRESVETVLAGEC